MPQGCTGHPGGKEKSPNACRRKTAPLRAPPTLAGRSRTRWGAKKSSGIGIEERSECCPAICPGPGLKKPAEGGLGWLMVVEAVKLDQYLERLFPARTRNAA